MITNFMRFLLMSTLIFNNIAHAETLATPTPQPLPVLTPTVPSLEARSYVLLDFNTNKILAIKDADVRMPPASLTKMMTSYIVAKALREGRIHLDDPVRISQKAWHMTGSKMFVKVGDAVTVRNLLQGIIVDSGNDACVAMAEHLAGSEEAFAGLMNQQAAELGMVNTHFTDSTGMPNAQHYMSAHDAAILARALIKDFPEDYKWYSQKWFTYNNIKQPNRNRLLWHDATVDGIKTGHTDEAGFCLVSSAVRNGMRLISVVMGTSSDAARTENSQNLLNYGFRFFESRKLYAANTPLLKARAWMGKIKEAPLGVSEDFYVVAPTGQLKNIKVNADINTEIRAPLKKSQAVGMLNVIVNGQKIASSPLVSLEEIPKGGLWTRMHDSIALGLHHFFNKSHEDD